MTCACWRFSAYGSTVLADAVIMQRYVESGSEPHTVISVVKVRGAKHSRQVRSVEMTAPEATQHIKKPVIVGLALEPTRYCTWISKRGAWLLAAMFQCVTV